jgi:solute carrier family 35 (UDP-galactose transporter), member B1
MSNSLIKLMIGVFGVYFCYITNGISEEELYSYKSRVNGEKFTATSFYLFIVCFINCVIAVIGMLVFTRSHRIPSTLQGITTGFSHVGAMYFASEALKHLTYPTQVLGKSCKMIPIMLFGFLSRGKSYTLRELVYVLLITIGVNFYLRSGEEEVSVYGLVLLFLSLMFDGTTTASQVIIRICLIFRHFLFIVYFSLFFF